MALDPTATLAVRRGNSFEAGFSPYRSTHLSAGKMPSLDFGELVRASRLPSRFQPADFRVALRPIIACALSVRRPRMRTCGSKTKHVGSPKREYRDDGCNDRGALPHSERRQARPQRVAN